MKAKQECETLMSEMLPFAKKMLREFGEFYPYGGYMKPDGHIVHVGAKGKGDYPKSKELLDLLRSSFLDMARAGACKAAAIVINARVTVPGTQGKTDAIQLFLDHFDGYSAEVFLPYEFVEGGRVVYGTIFAQEGRNELFR